VNLPRHLLPILIIILSYPFVAMAQTEDGTRLTEGDEAATSDAGVTVSEDDTSTQNGEGELPSGISPEAPVADSESDTDTVITDESALSPVNSEEPDADTETAAQSEGSVSDAVPPVPLVVSAEASDPGSQTESAAATQEPRSNSVLGIALAANGLIGGGFHESADVRNTFDTGVSLGLGLMTRVVELSSFRFGLNLGYVYFSNENIRKSAVIEVLSKKNRLHCMAFAEFYRKAFFVNAQMGAGFMVYSVETTLVQSSRKTVSSNVGIDPGFMTGLSIGLELGEHVFHISRELRVSVYSDWTRHDERDEFIIGGLISFELFSTFK
jgi:hypothetical protein